MPKVMLVEDDNNLREIYEARLIAEGYDIVSAHDGEEALALAVKERPDMIISDVMMPKISGFDMLDILRTTPETKNTKVIMMTALSQAEDRERADKLGADRYLVKSQVTLEDVVKVAREVLEGDSPTAAPAVETSVANETPAENPAPAVPDTDTPAPADIPVSTAPAAADDPAATPDPTPATPATDEPIANAAPASDSTAVPVTEEPITPITAVEPPPSTENVPELPTPGTPSAEAIVETPEVKPELTETVAEETTKVEEQIQSFISNNPSIPTPPVVEETPAAPPPIQAPAVPAPQSPSEAIESASEPATDEPTNKTAPPSHQRVIQPLNDDLTKGVDLNALLAKEEQDEGVAPPATNTIIGPDGTVVTPPVAPTPETPVDDKPHKPGETVDPNHISL